MSIGKLELDVRGISNAILDIALDREIGTFAFRAIKAIREEFFRGRKGARGVNLVSGRAAYGWKYRILKRRTPTMARGTVVIENKVPYVSALLQKRVITPENSKYLTVPMAGVKDSRGRDRFRGGAKQAMDQLPNFTLRAKSGKKFIVHKGLFRKDPKNPKAYLYALKDEVTVPGYLKEMPAFLENQLALLAPAMQASLRTK